MCNSPRSARNSAARWSSDRSPSRRTAATWWSSPTRMQRLISLNGKAETKNRGEAADQPAAQDRQVPHGGTPAHPGAARGGAYVDGDRGDVGGVREVGQTAGESCRVVPGAETAALEPQPLVRHAR